MYQVPGRVYGGEQNLKKTHHGPSAYGANDQGDVRSQWKHAWGSVLGGQRARREGGTRSGQGSRDARSGGRARKPGSGRPGAGRAATAASAVTAPARTREPGAHALTVRLPRRHRRLRVPTPEELHHHEASARSARDSSGHEASQKAPGRSETGGKTFGSHLARDASLLPQRVHAPGRPL